MHMCATYSASPYRKRNMDGGQAGGGGGEGEEEEESALGQAETSIVLVAKDFP